MSLAPYPRFNPSTGKPEIVAAGTIVYERTPLEMLHLAIRCMEVAKEAMAHRDDRFTKPDRLVKPEG